MADDVKIRAPRSVSQYNTYKQCGWRYKLERVDRVWQRPAAWLSQGTAVHAALEAWERSGRSMTVEAVQDVFRAEYEASIAEQAEVTPNTEYWFASGPYRGAVDIERRYGIGLEQCEKLMAWYDKHPEETVWVTPGTTDDRCSEGEHVADCECRDGTPAIELGYEVEIGGVPVRGFIDVIMDTPNGLVVRDIKGLALDTPLPTPSGWTTMGEVRVGDQVLDMAGNPSTVTAKSNAKRIGTYIVKFDDGSEVTCDSEHIWYTQKGNEKGLKARGVEEVIATLRNGSGRSHHRVPVAEPLRLPDADLPIKPYVFGAWIGDGKHTSGEICKDEALFELIKEEGYELGKAYRDPRSDYTVCHTVKGIRGHLASLGVLGNKHIPQAYLRGSYEQRLALLQGLMDTDGSWNKARKAATFFTVVPELAESAAELLHTLGQRPCVSPFKAKGYGKELTSYAVNFTPTRGLVPFRHPRKLASMEASGQKNSIKSTRRLIVAIEKGPDVETACISVDGVNNVYLCGKQMIPTHNTGNMPGDEFQLATYALAMKIMYDVEILTGDYFMGRTGKPTVPYNLADEVPLVPGKYAEMDAAVTAGVFEPNPDPKKCGFCGVRTSCDFAQL